MINNIRFTSNELYGIRPEIQENNTANQTTQDNIFENLVSSNTSEQYSQKNNQINLYSLGAPAGFFMDTSLFDAMEAGKDLTTM